MKSWRKNSGICEIVLNELFGGVSKNPKENCFYSEYDFMGIDYKFIIDKILNKSRHK